ncbi:hypothetical protein ACWD7F_35665 [Streptomyces sp. NPDC005122]
MFSFSPPPRSRKARAALTGDREAALGYLDEAQATAEQCGAMGVLGWIEQARTHV